MTRAFAIGEITATLCGAFHLHRHCRALYCEQSW